MSSYNDTKFAFFSENKGLGDLKAKTDVELKELLDRQDHLLINKSLINKLKDKGEKIRKVRDEISLELESRTVLNCVASKKPVKNSTAVEWRDSNSSTKDVEKIDNGHIEVKTDALKILSENGHVSKQESNNKSHITRLVEKEREPDFTFKPYNPAVAEKIKKICPDAHTSPVSSLVKTVHLDESLNLLSEQMSALKIFGTRSKRVEQCIEDRMNESAQEHELNEETDDQETKVGLGISVNINVED